jgi:hypothetical protein
VKQPGGRSRPYFFWSVERSESRIAQEAASTGREKIASQSRRTQAERSQKKYSRNVFGSFWRQKERTLKKEIILKISDLFEKQIHLTMII